MSILYSNSSYFLMLKRNADWLKLFSHTFRLAKVFFLLFSHKLNMSNKVRWNDFTCSFRLSCVTAWLSFIRHIDFKAFKGSLTYCIANQRFLLPTVKSYNLNRNSSPCLPVSLLTLTILLSTLLRSSSVWLSSGMSCINLFLL